VCGVRRRWDRGRERLIAREGPVLLGEGGREGLEGVKLSVHKRLGDGGGRGDGWGVQGAEEKRGGVGMVGAGEGGVPGRPSRTGGRRGAGD